MGNGKKAKIFSAIAAICMMVEAFDTIKGLHDNMEWLTAAQTTRLAIEAVLFIGLTIALFLNKKCAVMVAFCAMAVFMVYGMASSTVRQFVAEGGFAKSVQSVFRSWIAYVVAYIAMTLILILKTAGKKKAVTAWYVPGSLLFVFLTYIWLTENLYAYISTAWWTMLTGALHVVALFLTGLWAIEIDRKRLTIPENERILFEASIEKNHLYWKLFYAGSAVWVSMFCAAFLLPREWIASYRNGGNGLGNLLFFIIVAGSVTLILIGLIMTVNTENCKLVMTESNLYGLSAFGEEMKIPVASVGGVYRCAERGVAIASDGSLHKFFCLSDPEGAERIIMSYCFYEERP